MRIFLFGIVSLYENESDSIGCKKSREMILEAHVGKEEIHSRTGSANFVTDYDVKIQ